MSYPVRHRLGRRGGFLLAFAILALLHALTIYRHHEPVPHFWLLTHGWPIQCAGWAAAGVIAGWSAFRRQGRDAPGWSAAYVAAAYVAVVVLDGVLETAINGPGMGGDLIDVISSGGQNYAILAWIIIAAGWREPVEMPDFEKGSDR